MIRAKPIFFSIIFVLIYIFSSNESSIPQSVPKILYITWIVCPLLLLPSKLHTVCDIQYTKIIWFLWINKLLSFILFIQRWERWDIRQRSTWSNETTCYFWITMYSICIGFCYNTYCFICCS